MSPVSFVSISLGMFLTIIHSSATEAIEELACAIMNRIDGTDARKYDISPFLASYLGTVSVKMGFEITPAIRISVRFNCSVHVDWAG